jgi:hypothetical protein
MSQMELKSSKVLFYDLELGSYEIKNVSVP